MIRRIKKNESHLSSFAKKILHITIISCFFQYAWGTTPQEEKIWLFNKVSNMNLFEKDDREMRLQLNKLYGGVSVNTKDDVLTVNNSILESGTVCKIKYITLNKSALSYFYSEKTVSMYKELFKSEGLIFPEKIKVFTALDPDVACPAPYSDLVEVNNSLIFSDQDYVLFLNRSESNAGKAKFSFKEKDLNLYCKNDKNIKEYDGISSTICFFKGLSLKDSYTKFIELNKYASNYLQQNLTDSNESYKKNNASVSYVWHGSDELNIKLKNDGEESEYLFLKVNNGVSLSIKVDTGY